MRCVELAETRILAKEHNDEDWIFRSSPLSIFWVRINVAVLQECL
jgi:hypothetical protein